MKEKNNRNIWDQELKKDDGGFKMPDSYMDGLDAAILGRISELDIPKSKSISIKHWMIISSSIAAAIVIAIFLLIPPDSSEFDNIQIGATELDWDQYAVFEESWIMEELQNTDVANDVLDNDDVDYLLDIESLTCDEIIDEILENE